MKRKSPVKHQVKQYTRKGKVVREHQRGSGTRKPTRPSRVVGSMTPEFEPGYWDNRGKYQKEYDILWDELVPAEGQADTQLGELLRLVSKVYYDRYNNGFGNGPFREASQYLMKYAKGIKSSMPDPKDFDTFMEYFRDENYGEDIVGRDWKGDRYLEEVCDGVVAYIWAERSVHHKSFV